MAKPEVAMPEVVIVGSGFGGLTLAQSLARARVHVTVVDRTNHHLFQPLLYQVAIAGLSPADIASPIRSVLRNQANATVRLDEAVGVDFARQKLLLKTGELSYDYLALAVGGQTSYFGHPEWERHAPGLKTLDDAIRIRNRVLLAFERAELETDLARQRELLTFVIVGGGPTGVELAGAVAELARVVLSREFRRIDPRQAEIWLLEGGPRVLASFDIDLSNSAARQLDQLGVKVRLNTQVTGIDERGVQLGAERLSAATVIWGAGVCATPFNKSLNMPLDRAGRVLVEPDLTLPGQPHVYALGDMAAFLYQGGKPLPGVAQVAMQQAQLVAQNIQRSVSGQPRLPFQFHDKGQMATIGRSRAISHIGRWKSTGFVAWLVWLFVHLILLVGFRNRVFVFWNWMWCYLTYTRGARLITPAVEPPRPTSHETKSV